MSRSVCSFLLTVLLLVSPCVVAARQSPADLRKLEEAVLAALKERKTPGAAVAVVSGDRVVFSKGFGVADIEMGQPVTPDMLFRNRFDDEDFHHHHAAVAGRRGKDKTRPARRRLCQRSEPGARATDRRATLESHGGDDRR